MSVGRAPSPACVQLRQTRVFLSVMDEHFDGGFRGLKRTSCCRWTLSRARAPAPHFDVYFCGVYFRGYGVSRNGGYFLDLEFGG